MICLDASVVIAWLIPDRFSVQAIKVRRMWEQASERLIAPAFLQVEVTSVLRSFVHRGRISREEGDEAFESFRGLRVQYIDSQRLTDSAWRLAKEMGAPRAYDMFYLALADTRSTELWTADERLVNLVGPRRDSIRWLGNVTIDQDGS